MRRPPTPQVLLPGTPIIRTVLCPGCPRLGGRNTSSWAVGPRDQLRVDIREVGSRSKQSGSEFFFWLEGLRFLTQMTQWLGG